MADYKAIAEAVLPLVGGAENVNIATNCMTRLRLTLKDNSLVDLEGLKAIPGVLGAQFSGTQLQVIIGTHVPKVLDEFVAISGVSKGAAVDEKLDDLPAEKFEWTPANVGNAIMDYLSGSMTQLLPIIMAGGLVRTIAVVIGPQLLGLVAEESATYQFLYTTFYEGAFYFLPIYLGYAAAKKLGASQGLGMLLGAILIAPSITTAAAEGANISVYGISVAAADYSQSVLPMMLSVPVLWQVEKFFKKHMPDTLSTIFTPLCTMLVTVPIAFLVMGPIGNALGSIIGNALFAAAGFGLVGKLLVMAILGALWQLFVVAGMHMPIVMLALVTLMETGSDTMLFVATNSAMFAVWGCAIGAALRIKNRQERGMAWGYVISALAGGVTEPALFGVIMRWKRTMLGMFVGGAVGAVFCGIMGLTYYMAGGGTNLLVFLNYLQGGTGNLAIAVIGSIISVVLGAIVTYLFGFTAEELEQLSA